MEIVNELDEKAITLGFAEAAKRITESAEINSQMGKNSLFLPSFAGYEKARQEGQLAFFKVMGVKCRPLNPAESVRHKGKLAILSKIHSKEEAVEIQTRVQKSLKNITVLRFVNGVRV